MSDEDRQILLAIERGEACSACGEMFDAERSEPFEQESGELLCWNCHVDPMPVMKDGEE